MNNTKFTDDSTSNLKSTEDGLYFPINKDSRTASNSSNTLQEVGDNFNENMDFEKKYDYYVGNWPTLPFKEKFKAFRMFSWEFSKQFLPISLVFCIYIFVNIFNILFVSHSDSKFLLNGIGYGLNIYNMVAITISLGLSSALDTFCPHAYGAHQYRLMGFYLNRARIILTAVAIPIFFILFFLEQIMVAINQDPLVSMYAGKFCKGLLPGLLFFYYTDAQRR